MDIRIVAENSDVIPEYAAIPISFAVNTIFHVERTDSEEPILSEHPVLEPYLKDYDEQPENRPDSWSERWNLENWGFLSAFINDRRVGCAAIAYDTDDLSMLENREDLAVLWDIRVLPDYRHQGIGKTLFEAAVEWAKTRQCSLLKIETQNINVAACRFYERCGCHLGEVNTFAYSDYPDEAQLLWYKKLQ